MGLYSLLFWNANVQNIENKFDLTSFHYEVDFKVMHSICTLHCTGLAFQHHSFVVTEIGR